MFFEYLNVSLPCLQVVELERPFLVLNRSTLRDDDDAEPTLSLFGNGKAGSDATDKHGNHHRSAASAAIVAVIRRKVPVQPHFPHFKLVEFGEELGNEIIIFFVKSGHFFVFVFRKSRLYFKEKIQKFFSKYSSSQKNTQKPAIFDR